MHKLVKLKNGSEEPENVVRATMISLEYLWRSGIPGMTQVYDLVQICRQSPDYKSFGSNEDTLKELCLLQDDGRPHQSVRNITLSAIEGEGLDMKLVSPIAT